MAVYDLEEQEQLEDLKAWWRRWGNLISGVVIAVCVAIVGVQGWRWWQHNQAEQAAVLYGAIAVGGPGQRRRQGQGRDEPARRSFRRHELRPARCDAARRPAVQVGRPGRREDSCSSFSNAPARMT
jgi:hypothetical protein